MIPAATQYRDTHRRRATPRGACFLLLLVYLAAGCSSLRGRIEDGRYVAPGRFSIAAPELGPGSRTTDHVGPDVAEVAFSTVGDTLYSLQAWTLEGEALDEVILRPRRDVLRPYQAYREQTLRTRVPTSRFSEPIFLANRLGGAFYTEIVVPEASSFTYFSSSGGEETSRQMDLVRGMLIWIDRPYVLTAEVTIPASGEEERSSTTAHVHGDALRDRVLEWAQTLRVER